MELPLVSICCTAYNHEKYIAEAIEGFINQKTEFKFEILIHDDASTDKTANIIREYEKKYPDLIKPLYQKENQYSKKIPVTSTYLYPNAKGKYIALCEGDDYWIDPYKLRKQISYMEKHSECTFCFTNSKIIDERGKNKDKVFIPYEKENERYYSNSNEIYNLGKLALLGFIPTATFVFPKSILKDLPAFFNKRYSAGDIKLKLYAASKGYAYFINDITSVYRANVAGSAMTKWRNYSRGQLINHNQGYIDLIDTIDEYTNYKYNNDLDKLKINFEFAKLSAMSDKEIYNNERYKDILKDFKIIEKVKKVCVIYFPKLTNLVKRYIKKIFDL